MDPEYRRRRHTLSSVLRWIQRLLFVLAISLLGYGAFVLTDAWMFQNREGRRLNRLIRQQPPADRARKGRAPGVSPPDVATDDIIGRIVIPRLGMSVMIAEGVDRLTLRRAAGHIPGTALPGAPGNVAISGHRDTFFRPLRNIRSHDIITLTTPLGEYRYRVVSTRITGPSDIAVLRPGEKQTLTLITCYPFYFVGSAPRRYVVRAERVVADSL